jgi:uncharacterized protein (TIGR00369 family)
MSEDTSKQPATIGRDSPQQPDGASLVQQWFEHSPFVSKLGLRLLSISDGQAELELPFDQSLATAGDLIHGGALATLIDTAATVAAWSGHTGDGTSWGTISMSVNYLAGGRASALRAVACVRRRGKTVCFCRVEVEDEAGHAIAEGQVVYRLS